VKILLDECLPLDLRHHLPGYEVHTAEWAGLKGLKNGQLLAEAEIAGYDVLVTTDQGIPHQQSLAGRKISVILIRARSNQLEDLVPAVEAILRELRAVRQGQVLVVSGSLIESKWRRNHPHHLGAGSRSA
jgi:predicted nuclease of predicted toxin-antitoxin system